MKKKKAFTLIEMIVAMIVTSTVIIISSFAYIYLTRTFKEISKAIIDKEVLTEMVNLFRSDMYFSESVNVQQNILQVVKYDESKTIYKLNEDYFIRQTNSRIDTFLYHLEVVKSNVKFNGGDNYKLTFSRNGEIERSVAIFKLYSIDESIKQQFSEIE